MKANNIWNKMEIRSLMWEAEALGMSFQAFLEENLETIYLAEISIVAYLEENPVEGVDIPRLRRLWDKYIGE